MKSLKIILLAALFCSAFVACEKTDLNEDELMLNNSDVIYATGGEIDNAGGLN